MLSLRRLLDLQSGGALEKMNNLCREQGLEGYITAFEEGVDAVFAFTAYKAGKTAFFATARIAGGGALVEEVQTSEEIRLLKKVQPGGQPRKTVWN